MFVLALAAAALTTDRAVVDTDSDVWVCKVKRKQYVHVTTNADPKNCHLQRQKGSNWAPFLVNPDGSMYSVDRSRVTQREGATILWVKEDYSADPKRLFFFDKVSMVTTEYKFSCANMTIQTLTVYGYDPKGLKIISDENDSEPSTIGPDTIGAFLAKEICQ